MPTHLLDANALIDADRDYYPINRVPEFWDWLVHHGENGRVKVCQEVFEEVTAGTGRLVDWIEQDEVRAALLLPDVSDPAVVSRIVSDGYANDLTDIEIVALGRDPFLIAHAVADTANRFVVTTEKSAPRKIRQNRKVPDVCRDFGVACYHPFELIQRLDFRTGWRR